MKFFSLFFVSISFFLLISLQPSYSETIIPGGNVSGTWTAAGSPYLVQGNITIQADSTLTIEPGVEVIFQANYYLIVYGWLEAVGTETDSIHFSAVTTWAGLAFSNAPDSSHLEYCSISGSSFTGIQSSNSNPVITSCKISNNGGAYHGGIVLENSNARITQCDIINNFGYGQSGGGIYIGANSSPEISYCNITGNSCNNGGGIYVTGSNPMISHCTVSGNSANLGGGISFMGGGHGIITDCFITSDTAEVQGGGIYISSPGGVVNINNSTIYNCTTNSTTSQGGGIYISPADTVSIVSTIIDSNYALGSVEPYGGGAIFSGDCNHLVLNHCDVVNNRAGLIEGGIMLYGNTDITVKNSIFRHQQGYHIFFQSYTSAAVSFSDFYDSWLSPPFQSPPAGLGTITQVNANGDSCDVFHNIYLDPLFVDFANSDYHLSWANWPTPDSTKSPCIDAGDPSDPLDPDTTITDMGVFSFDQRIPDEVSVKIHLPIEFKLYQNYPNPFNPSTRIKYTIPQFSQVQIKVYNVLGREVTTLVNEYKPAGEYEMKFTASNLPSGIYFYRIKAGTYTETKKMILLK